MSLITWRDMLDILLVTLLLYRLLVLVKGTRIVSALIGLLLLAVVYIGAEYVGLYTLSWLLEHLFNSLFLVLVILFHDDLRHALSSIGARYFRPHSKAQGDIIDDLAWVCAYFSKRRIGALVVIERRERLGDMLKGGVVIDAKLSRELLLTIFFHNTALHDGAVLIRDGRIAEAGCILPLAQVDSRQQFGTRHRAAIGATESSDAVVVAVSEERGETSVAIHGHLKVIPDTEHLKETLRHALT